MYLIIFHTKLTTFSDEGGVTEARDNVNDLMGLLNLKAYDRPFFIETDMKLANIIIGIGTHASSMPCPYCTSKRGDDKKYWKDGVPRSFQSLHEHYEAYLRDGLVKARRKMYGSVENRSILTPADMSILVLLLIPPPPLHVIKLGIFK